MEIQEKGKKPKRKKKKEKRHCFDQNSLVSTALKFQSGSLCQQLMVYDVTRLP